MTIQLSEVVKQVKTGNVSDDDLKKLGDAIADTIDKGTSAMRVGTRVATAIKAANKRNRKRRPIEPKPINNFYRLKKHIHSTIEGITFWADGTMKPETEDEAECAKIILAGAANMIIQFARLGIDVQGIYETFIQGDQINESREKNKYHQLKKIN